MTLKEIELAVRTACGEHVETHGTAQVHFGMPKCRWIVLTGGEPALQLQGDRGRAFCDYFHKRGCLLAIETNGTLELPFRLGCEDFDCKASLQKGVTVKAALGEYDLDWICVSPKSAEHTLRQPVAHEVKYVRFAGQAIPKPSVKALHYVLSPAFEAGIQQPDGTVHYRPSYGATAHCLKLCRENPEWRLSVQNHKIWNVR